MFNFKLELDISLLTVTRKGFWKLDTVVAYEAALRQELSNLKLSARPTSFIIDIRSSGMQDRPVTEALRSMVARLGDLYPDKIAIVTLTGLAKLEAMRVSDANARVFTTMVLARDWVTGAVRSAPAAGDVHDVASNAEAECGAVHVEGPDGVDVMLTSAAALETGKRISNAAVEALLDPA